MLKLMLLCPLYLLLTTLGCGYEPGSLPVHVQELRAPPAPDAGNPTQAIPECKGEGESCYEGPPATMDLGRCSAGVRVCFADGRMACVGQLLPAGAEACNLEDDDCDGKVDEDFNLLEDVENCGACGNRCKAGLLCRAGACTEPTEVCDDGEDNDGDGWTDCQDLDCDGTLHDGYTCSTRTRKETACGDGQDNDGDGRADCQDSDCNGVVVGGFKCSAAHRVEVDCQNAADDDGDGLEDCQDSDCIGLTPTLDVPVVYRDFIGKNSATSGNAGLIHPDFNDKANMQELGIVAPMLGSDGKPVYAKDGVSSATTSGKANFDEWYRDGSRSQATNDTLELIRQPDGSYLFDRQSFFPLDGKGWVGLGREYPLTNGHNFSFTSEARFQFEYQSSEVLTFRGDDDVWVFINGRLAADLGGVYPVRETTVTLSQRAAELELQLGKVYEVAIFQAERHVTVSSYRLNLYGFRAWGVCQ